MTRPVRLAVRVVDGPYRGRTLLVTNPAPPKLVLPLQGGQKIEYRIEDRGNGLYAFKGGPAPVVDRDLPRIGWRMWHAEEQLGVMLEDGNAVEREVHLLSTNATPWPYDGPLVATCNGEEPTNHPVPQQACMCGIYAARTFDWLNDKGYTRGVFGLVSGWGRTVEHEQGWRFERAYPLVLVVDGAAFYPGSRRLSHGLMGDVITGEEPVVEVDPALQMARLLAARYRVPVAVGGVETAVRLVSKVLELGKVPKWVYQALPPDLMRVKRPGTPEPA